ncbi:uncharacterized protein LOC124896879 [Capsicum annuum]|uniref:uncharacterized protein LOC124896879 n=1 Tax=Capsicum annuum TaxID=4072 RepID=UPI001FB1700E|nr:uncharacterized protein LOC124896879 [Capsicum annuum]
MESGDLSCDQNKVLISYLMNGRGQIHPTFIRNDRHVELYMLCIDSDNSRPILRVKVFERFRKEASTSTPPSPSPSPPPPNVDDTSKEYDFMGCNEWDNSEYYEEEECGGGEDGQLEPQRSHSFSDGTNLFLGQTFKDKKTLKLLLKQASVKISFNYTTLKSSKKYLRGRCVDRTWRWMVHACAIEELGWFHVHKYVGEHTYGIDHVTGKHKNVTVEAELLKVLDGRRHCEEHSLRYARAWICSASRISYIFDGLNLGSINSLRVEEEYGRLIYYFMAFRASIRGYAHMRKVVTVDDTHLSNKYEGVMLSTVAQVTQNHIYPLAYYVVDKENDASWGFFFEKLKAFVVDEPELCIISDRHVSIANGLARHYPLAHHGVCVRHLGENLQINHHCSDSLYLYYHTAKAYTLEEFNDYFNALKERCPSAATCLKH